MFMMNFRYKLSHYNVKERGTAQSYRWSSSSQSWQSNLCHTHLLAGKLQSVPSNHCNQRQRDCGVRDTPCSFSPEGRPSHCCNKQTELRRQLVLLGSEASGDKGRQVSWKGKFQKEGSPQSAHTPLKSLAECWPTHEQGNGNWNGQPGELRL